MCCKLQQMNKIVESETTYNELFCKPNVLNNNPRANFVMRKSSSGTSFISFPFLNFCKKIRAYRLNFNIEIDLSV